MSIQLTQRPITFRPSSLTKSLLSCQYLRMSCQELATLRASRVLKRSFSSVLRFCSLLERERRTSAISSWIELSSRKYNTTPGKLSGVELFGVLVRDRKSSKKLFQSSLYKKTKSRARVCVNLFWMAFESTSL